MFCALNGTTSRPASARSRHNPALTTLLPTSDAVPSTARAAFTLAPVRSGRLLAGPFRDGEARLPPRGEAAVHPVPGLASPHSTPWRCRPTRRPRCYTSVVVHPEPSKEGAVLVHATPRQAAIERDAMRPRRWAGSTTVKGVGVLLVVLWMVALPGCGRS